MKTENFPPQQINTHSLRQPSLWKWLGLASFDWLVIIIALFAASRFHTILSYWLASLVIGTRQHALAFMGHDGAHRSVSKNKTLNDIITGLFSFWPLGIGLSGYRHFHFHHHRRVGTPLDPELTHKSWAAPEFALPLKPIRLLLWIIKDLCGFGFRDLVRLVRLTPPRSVQDIIGPVIVIGINALILWHTDNLWILGIWYWSMGTSFWAVFRLRVWIEHVGTCSTSRVHASLWERFIFAPHNSWCHYEHHKWPSIPCWNLPEIRNQDTSCPVVSIRTLFKQFTQAPGIRSGELGNME